jgi:hypothetical protein
MISGSFPAPGLPFRQAGIADESSTFAVRPNDEKSCEL